MQSSWFLSCPPHKILEEPGLSGGLPPAFQPQPQAPAEGAQPRTAAQVSHGGGSRAKQQAKQGGSPPPHPPSPQGWNGWGASSEQKWRLCFSTTGGEQIHGPPRCRIQAALQGGGSPRGEPVPPHPLWAAGAGGSQGRGGGRGLRGHQGRTGVGGRRGGFSLPSLLLPKDRGVCRRLGQASEGGATYQGVSREHLQERNQVVSIAEVFVQVVHVALGLRGQRRGSGAGPRWGQEASPPPPPPRHLCPSITAANKRGSGHTKRQTPT